MKIQFSNDLIKLNRIIIWYIFKVNDDNEFFFFFLCLSFGGAIQTRIPSGKKNLKLFSLMSLLTFKPQLDTGCLKKVR